MKRGNTFLLLFFMLAATIGAFMFLKNGPNQITGLAYSGSSAGNLTLCLNFPITNLTAVVPQSANSDEIFYLDMNTTNETDGIFANLAFSDDSSLFAINPSTGNITFVPLKAQSGTSTVNISVDTGICAGTDDSETFSLTVVSKQHAPDLSMPATISLTEDVQFIYNVTNNVTDAELTYETESFSFYASRNSLFDTIGQSTGLIIVTPTNSLVGTYSVYITVVDSTSLTDAQSVSFVVANVNDAPVLSAIGAQTVRVNETLSFTASATDVDSGDTITYYDNTSLFDIGSSTGAVSFIPTAAQQGTYSVNISVLDANGASDSEVISLTVLEVNHAPNITGLTPTNNATISLLSDDTQSFNISKYDEDGTTPSAYWYVDGVLISSLADSYTYTAPSSTASHVVMAFISDGLLNNSEKWNVSVSIRPQPGGYGSTGGGGGGGGRPRCSTPLWTCTSWSTCQKGGIQTRMCTDINNCGNVEGKPEETQSCEFVERPTCFDGIKDQDEILPDCGGSCKPCPTCDDKIQNQGEESVDCGGPCPVCKQVIKKEEISPLKPACGDGLIEPNEVFSCLNDSWTFWMLTPVALFLIFKLAFVLGISNFSARIVRKGYTKIKSKREHGKFSKKIL